MIAFNGVSYFFSKEIGVKDVNFEISQDEFAFLIGPTGSGKTTIMRLIYMDLMPDEGFVTVGGISSNKIKKKTKESHGAPKNRDGLSGLPSFI